MTKSRWHEVPKIDFHTHVVLHEREDTDLKLNTPEMMLEAMEKNNLERAVVLPINYSEYFPLTGDERQDWLKANNDRQAALMKESDGRLVAFADCALGDIYGGSWRVATELERAIKELGLQGLKIHPSNLKIAADDPRLFPIVKKAGGLKIPIVIHSYPSASDPMFDLSAPERIFRLIWAVGLDPDERPPFIVAHIGGVRFLETIVGGGYVDLSGTLLDICDLYGTEFAERLLRRIGLNRVLFGTDYPIFPYERYFEVLDQMHFTAAEIEQIAYKNAAKILGLGL